MPADFHFCHQNSESVVEINRWFDVVRWGFVDRRVAKEFPFAGLDETDSYAHVKGHVIDALGLCDVRLRRSEQFDRELCGFIG